MSNPAPLAPGLTEALRAQGADDAAPVLDLVRLMWTIEHDLNLLSKHLEASKGISGSHLTLLRLVTLFPGISATRLSEILQLHPSTLSGAFRHLTQRELLERREDSDDARRARLYPTAKSAELLQQQAGTVDAPIERVVRKMAPADLEAARAVLQQIAYELQREVAAASSGR